MGPKSNWEMFLSHTWHPLIEDGWAFGRWGMFQWLVNAPWMSFNAPLSLLPLPTPPKKTLFGECGEEREWGDNG
jgi:hypothetical protein